MFITTPRGSANWIYDLYTNAAHLEDYQSFQYTTLDGGNVPQEEITAAKRELDEKSFRQEYMATFESYSGLIYYNWEPKRNITPHAPEISDRTLLHIGMDINVDPLVACISTVTGEDITIFDEVVICLLYTSDAADE